MSIFFKRNCAGYLVDPITRAALNENETGFFADHDPAKIYLVLEGVVQMGDGASSAAYDRACEAKGWEVPDAFTFRQLPRYPLANWEANYWKKRALSTAAIWSVLEEDRRRKRQLPIGMIGVAADLSDGLPYLAYGLDTGGYMAFALSPYAGRYGLGAYSLTRYCRVQVDPSLVPLKANMFDVITFTGGLIGVTGQNLQNALRWAAEALKKGGLLVISDTANTAELVDGLKAAALKTEVRPVYNLEATLLDRARRWLGQDVQVPPLVIGQKV